MKFYNIKQLAFLSYVQLGLKKGVCNIVKKLTALNPRSQS